MSATLTHHTAQPAPRVSTHLAHMTAHAMLATPWELTFELVKVIMSIHNQLIIIHSLLSVISVLFLEKPAHL